MRKPIKRYLGNLCKRNHEYENTGKTLRLESSGDCIECAQLRREKRKLTGYICPMKPDRRNQKREARAQASLHCIHYDECLGSAARSGQGLHCFECERFERIENNYRKGLRINMLNRRVNRYPVGLNPEKQRG